MAEYIEREVLSSFDKEMLITPTSKEHQSLVEQWQRHKEKYGKEMVGDDK